MSLISQIVAFSSAAAFALQISLALLMLSYFQPEDVGSLMVINQISFFWATLALAQSPLRLLAEQSASVFNDVREAWISSSKRFALLIPFSTFVIWFSDLHFVSSLIWALVLSFSLMTWLLAQSMRLRMVGLWHQIGVRVVPQFVSLFSLSVAILINWNGPSLLFAAFSGYAAGAAWLLISLGIRRHEEAITEFHNNKVITSTSSNQLASFDDRSAGLRMFHTLVEVLLATAVLVVWQRLYGTQETGWMAGTLKMMGFVPAVVHIAWAQVLLAQPHRVSVKPLWVGLGGFAIVALLGFCCAIALDYGLLGNQWTGVKTYLFPLALWQGSACMAAALSHLPFQTQSARKYSWVCIGVAGVQAGILFAPYLFGYYLPAENFIYWFAGISSIGLLGLSIWLYLKVRN